MGDLEINNYRNELYRQKIRESISDGSLEWGDIAGSAENNWHRQQAVSDFFIPKLTKSSKFLDLGCGSLTSCKPIIDFLDNGNYYGLELIPELLFFGVEYLEKHHPETYKKLNVDHLIVGDDFPVLSYGVRFDLIVALSVFTHATRVEFQACIAKISQCLAPGGQFYFTFVSQKQLNFNPRAFYELKEDTPHNLSIQYIGTWTNLNFTLGNQQMARVSRKF